MLISFYESYLILVELCALLALLVNFYNLAQYLTQRRRRLAQLRRQNELIIKISTYNANINSKDGEGRNGQPDLSSQDYKLYRSLSRKVRRGGYLRILDNALEELGWHAIKEEYSKFWLIVNLALNDNLQLYSRMDDAVRSLVINLGIRSGLHTPEFQAYLLECLERPALLSICALRGCAIQGNQQFMLTALDKINAQERSYGAKLLTDVFMAYQGDRENLFAAVWERLNAYSLNLARSFIGLLTNEAISSYAPAMLERMQDEKWDKELRIAAIKYFDAVRYPEAQGALATFLSHEEWEYAAVAARVLRGYSCEHCACALIDALSSRSWHVRFNSAMTLVSCCPERITEALNSQDRYARDIVSYALDIQEGDAA